MPGPPGDDRIDQAVTLGRLDHRRRGVTQARHGGVHPLKRGHRCLALLAADVVLGLGQLSW